MNRRTFLGYSAVLASSGTLRCAPGAPSRKSSGGSFDEPFELHEATVFDLQQGMESGRFTARSITEAYLARIEALDRRGPELRSILETNPDALSIADELDSERRASGPRGPLHGIPVALKDNIDTHDRMTTTAGSLALEGSIPPRDSFLAEKLREAGAILLAKANMSEWAYLRPRPLPRRRGGHLRERREGELRARPRRRHHRLGADGRGAAAVPEVASLTRPQGVYLVP